MEKVEQPRHWSPGCWGADMGERWNEATRVTRGQSFHGWRKRVENLVFILRNVWRYQMSYERKVTPSKVTASIRWISHLTMSKIYMVDNMGAPAVAHKRNSGGLLEDNAEDGKKDRSKRIPPKCLDLTLLCHLLVSNFKFLQPLSTVRQHWLSTTVEWHCKRLQRSLRSSIGFAY